MLNRKELLERAARIKLLLLDVDGVMTRGEIIIHPDGRESKIFNVQDGHGIRLAHRAGLKTGIITGRESEAVEHRARDLGIEIVCQRRFDKLGTCLEVAQSTGIPLEEIAFVGDDLTDVPTMRSVGLAFAVANARPEVKERAHYVTAAEGGQGAVREVIELLLKAGGRWESVTERYFGPLDKK